MNFVDKDGTTKVYIPIHLYLFRSIKTSELGLPVVALKTHPS